MSERGQSVYNWWSRHESLFDVGFLGRETELRERAVELLDLDSGERVLELGCGPDNSFDALRTRVGSQGAVVGVDCTHGMVEHAAERVWKTGCENVHALRGDSDRLGVSDEVFDAVYASITLSTMAKSSIETWLSPRRCPPLANCGATPTRGIRASISSFSQRPLDGFVMYS